MECWGLVIFRDRETKCVCHEDWPRSKSNAIRDSLSSAQENTLQYAKTVVTLYLVIVCTMCSQVIDLSKLATLYFFYIGLLRQVTSLNMQIYLVDAILLYC